MYLFLLGGGGHVPIVGLMAGVLEKITHGFIDVVGRKMMLVAQIECFNLCEIRSDFTDALDLPRWRETPVVSQHAQSTQKKDEPPTWRKRHRPVFSVRQSRHSSVCLTDLQEMMWPLVPL